MARELNEKKAKEIVESYYNGNQKLFYIWVKSLTKEQILKLIPFWHLENGESYDIIVRNLLCAF